MCIAGAGAFFTISLCVSFISINLSSYPLLPWKGFAHTHAHFSVIVYIPAKVWRSSAATEFSYEYLRWVYVFCAFVFFGFFGFAKEARRNYRSAALYTAKKLRISSISRYGASRLTATPYY
jgi:pheromone a factor receptor